MYCCTWAGARLSSSASSWTATGRSWPGPTEDPASSNAASEHVSASIGSPTSRAQSHTGTTIPPPHMPAAEKKIRVVVAKPGLDGHDRGAKIIARALRDAGMEVIYTGLHQTPEQIVETVVQEEADAVGLSVLSGAHMTLFERLTQLLRERGIDDVVVFGGGIIPDEDLPELQRMGVARIFTPGATTSEIVDWVREHVGAPTGA